MSEKLKQEVSEAIEGAGESSDQTPSESVPSGDVKPTEAPVEKKAEEPKPIETTPVNDVSKFEEQIENLNKALQREREEAKALKEKLTSFEDPLNKLKSVFAPQEQPEPEDPKFLTKEELDAYYEEKEQERIREETNKKMAEAIQLEVKKLETEWDGSEWKPKYDDQEVIKWQKDNNKLYLSPSEAFFAMKREELIDYEVKQKLSWKPEVKEMWKTSPTETETKEQPKELDDSQMRDAVREAIESQMAPEN